MRNKDFHLEYNAETGEYTASENRSGNAIFNRILTAINIRRGTLISNEKYGSNIHRIKLASADDEQHLSICIKYALNPLKKDVEKMELTSCKIDTTAGFAEIKIFCQYKGSNYTFAYWIKI